MQTENYSVLVVTKDSKISSQITAFLTPPLFTVVLCTDFSEARRCISERVFNIIIVDSGDGSDADFAVEVSSSTATVLLMVSPDKFEQISFKVEEQGILTITKPFDSFYFYNMIKIAIAVQYKVQIFSSQTIKLKEKMEEIRIINQAKIILMQKRSMTESEAHRHIEKEAMDRCIKKLAVAQEIIKGM